MYKPRCFDGCLGSSEQPSPISADDIDAWPCHHDHIVMTMVIVMQIPAGEFKAKCLQIMEGVARTGKSVTITKRGRPVAKLVPLDAISPRAALFGRMAGSVTYEGDLLSPIDNEWEALNTVETLAYAGVKKERVVHRVTDKARQKSRR